MTTRHLSPRLSTLAVESHVRTSAPVIDYWSPTWMGGPRCGVFARPGRGKGALIKRLYVRALAAWPVIVCDPQQDDWNELAARLGGTPIRPGAASGPLDVLGGLR
jgi:hypothetical protein